jgi:hypothetical protein
MTFRDADAIVKEIETEFGLAVIDGESGLSIANALIENIERERLEIRNVLAAQVYSEESISEEELAVALLVNVIGIIRARLIIPITTSDHIARTKWHTSQELEYHEPEAGVSGLEFSTIDRRTQQKVSETYAAFLESVYRRISVKDGNKERSAAFISRIRSFLSPESNE